MRQRVIPLVYKGMQRDSSYRVDLIVEDVVVVEAKCLTDCPAGLLINFNEEKLMDGVRRLILPTRGVNTRELNNEDP
jgi:hypothetical protein